MCIPKHSDSDVDDENEILASIANDVALTASSSSELLPTRGVMPNSQATLTSTQLELTTLISQNNEFHKSLLALLSSVSQSGLTRNPNVLNERIEMLETVQAQVRFTELVNFLLLNLIFHYIYLFYSILLLSVFVDKE